MRIAHFSDLHYAPETLAEVDRCFGAAIEAAIEAGAEAAVISGDATDHRLDLHSPAAVRLARRLQRLADHCPVLMLQGTFSHEPPGTLEMMRLIDARHEIVVAGRIAQIALVGDRWVESEGWRFPSPPAGARLLVSAVPTVNKAEVAAVRGAEGAARAAGEAIAEVLRGFAEANEAAREAGIPTVGVGHGTVSGAVTEHGVPMAGLDHEFTEGALFSAGCSAFLLGHIHKHQVWEREGRLAAYAGSIGRLHYGEEGPKGFLLWDVEALGARFSFVETPARRMVCLDFQGPPDMEAIRSAAAEARGAFVRVRWQVDEEHRDAVDRKAIEAALEGAAEVRLEGRILPVARVRAAGIGRAPSLAAKLKRWCEATDTPAEGLAERLERLLALEPEALAAEAAGDGDEGAAR